MPDNHQNTQLDRVREITSRLEEGVKEIFSSDRYKTWMNTMSKFHSYSLNNTILIALQKPDATLVAGYNAWKNMGRQVKRGEKAIRILAPAPYKRKIEVDKLDPFTQLPVLDADGNTVKETREIQQAAFKVVNVFDISATDGKELPTLGAEELTGDVEQYETFIEALKLSCPVSISFEEIDGSAKGYYSITEDRIAIREGMSQIQTAKTVIHEMAHQKMHCPHVTEPEEPKEDAPSREQSESSASVRDEQEPDDSSDKQQDISRDTKEIQAESVAYTICQHYGIDTSDYSFSYIATWSKNKDLSQLKESMDAIRTAASEMITEIDGHLKDLVRQKSVTQEHTASIKAKEAVTSDHTSQAVSKDQRIRSRSDKIQSAEIKKSVLDALKTKQQQSGEIRKNDRPVKIRQEERAS